MDSGNYKRMYLCSLALRPAIFEDYVDQNDKLGEGGVYRAADQ